MKLLVVSHSCAVAANQQIYAELQARTGWEITLVIPAGWKDEFGNILDEPPLPGLAQRAKKIPVLGNGRIILHVYRKRWEKFLREEKFDVIYMNHEPYALATAAVCLANLRQAQPAVFGFYSCQNLQKKYPFPFSRLERLVYDHSQFAFPITNAVADVLRAKGYAGLTPICPLPVDLEVCFPRGRANDEQLIPRAPDETVVGFVGRLVETKGLRTLAHALGQLADLSWKLAMVGTGDFAEEFRTVLASYKLADRATFFGYIPHEKAPEYLSALDLLVLPSETQPNWKEQFGRVITESLACSTAVVGSDSGEIPRLVKASGGGLVFPERQADALAAALRTLIQDRPQREALAAAGRAWVEENVSIKGVAATMAATMEEALQPFRSRS